MTTAQPGVIVRQFTSIWDAPIEDLRTMEAHAKAHVEKAAAISFLDRLSAEAALSTIQREIARKEQIAALEAAR
jgi:hypothetical protein